MSENYTGYYGMTNIEFDQVIQDLMVTKGVNYSTACDLYQKERQRQEFYSEQSAAREYAKKKEKFERPEPVLRENELYALAEGICKKNPGDTIMVYEKLLTGEHLGVKAERLATMCRNDSARIIEHYFKR